MVDAIVVDEKLEKRKADDDFAFGLSLRSRVQEHYQLPTYQTVVAALSLISLNVYGFYHLYLHSNEFNHEPEYTRGQRYTPLAVGKWIPGRRYDTLDYEWESTKRRFIKFIFAGIIHSLIVFVTDHLGLFQYRRYTFIVTGVVALLFFSRPHGIVLVVGHLVICYVVLILTGRMSLIWILQCILMYAGNSTEMVSNMDYDSFCALFWNLMRVVSFADDYCTAKAAGKSLDNFTPAHYFGYVLYLPLQTGPPVIFRRFLASAYVVDPWTATRIARLFKMVATLLVWTLILEVSKHYFYVFYLTRLKMTSISLDEAFVVSWMFGWNMQAKYMVIYGLPKLFGIIDGVHVPGLPECVSRIYLYSNMWKKFDKGLHNFMVYHIYIPLGGNKMGHLRQTFSLVVIFSFIWYWHGSDSAMGLWSILNALEILLERFGSAMFKSERGQRMAKSMSPQSFLRLKALVCTACFVMSTVAILHFFLKFDGMKLPKKMFWDSYLFSAINIFGFYCIVCCCFAMEFREAKSKLKKTFSF